MILRASGFKKKTRQRMLQVGMGIGLVFLAFLLEMVAIEPSGIYSYSCYGYKGFKIGLSRKDLLKKINRVISIRRIRTCDPWNSAGISGPADLKLTSRRSFEITDALIRSDIWICQGKKKVGFLFQFQGDHLVRVLRLKGSSFKEVSFPMFDQCHPEIYRDMDGYLKGQSSHDVFSEGDCL